MKTFLSTKSAGATAASLLFVVYYFTSANYLADGDSGEFAYLALNRTIAHPPGYPLYSYILVGLGYVTHSLFIHTLFSGLCVAAAIGLQFITWQGIISGMGLFVACLVAGLSPPIWQIATSTEPFALNLLLCSAVIYFQVRILRQNVSAPKLWQPFLFLGLLFGWGFCNHHILVLLAPGTLIAYFCNQSARNNFVKTVGLFSAGFLLGLLPISYFLVADSNNLYSWGNWSQFWPQLVHHMLRRDYGTFTLSSSVSGIFHWKPLWYYLSMLPFYLGFCFLAGVIPCLVRRNCPGLLRKTWSKQTLILVLCNVFFTNILFTLKLGDVVDGPDSIVLQRFFALSLITLLPVYAFILEMWFSFFNSRAFRIISLIVIVTTSFLLHVEQSNRRKHHLIDDYIYNITHIIPANTILMTSSDFDYYGMIYSLDRNVPEKKIRVIHPTGWGHPFYREKIIDFTGYPDSNGIGFSNFFNWMIATRQVYLTELAFAQLAPYLPYAEFKCPIARINPINAASQPFAEQLKEIQRIDASLKYPTKEAIDNATEWELQALRVWRTCWQKFGEHSQMAGSEPTSKRLEGLDFQ